MEWIPTRAGNWLMHCHLVDHITPFPERDEGARAHDRHDAIQHALSAMAGLVLGIVVSEDGASVVDSRPPEARAATRVVREAPEEAARQLVAFLAERRLIGGAR